MVNKLSELAAFLEDDSLPSWIKLQVRERQQEITDALAKGAAITLRGPNGETVTITPKVAAVA